MELKYHDGQIDMGIFGPTSLVSATEAEAMIEDFRSSLAKIVAD